jgi:hypothetical protein
MRYMPWYRLFRGPAVRSPTVHTPVSPQDLQGDLLGPPCPRAVILRKCVRQETPDVYPIGRTTAQTSSSTSLLRCMRHDSSLRIAMNNHFCSGRTSRAASQYVIAVLHSSSEPLVYSRLTVIAASLRCVISNLSEQVLTRRHIPTYDMGRQYSPSRTEPRGRVVRNQLSLFRRIGEHSPEMKR